MSYVEIFHLDRQIEKLERELSRLKYQRRSLKAAVAMRAKWNSPDFRQKAMASINARAAESAARLAKVRHNTDNRLPWPNGTPERNRYRNLVRKGWTRDLAIEKISAEAFP